MSVIPGMGLVRGMGLTLRRFFQPKATIMWPEQHADVAPKFRGRLQLLYDEYGTLKCETCFQCAQACPIECIDMGGVDTKGRFHVHWGAPETYGERREESALRRSGRPVADPAFTPLRGHRPRARWTRSSRRTTTTRSRCSRSSRRRRPSTATCRSPRSSTSRRVTGAWYAMIYGTATYYRHLRFEPPAVEAPAAGEAHRADEAAFRSALDASLGYGGRAS